MSSLFKNMFANEEETIEREVSRRVSYITEGLSLQPLSDPFGNRRRPLHRPLLWECGNLANLVPPTRK